MVQDVRLGDVEAARRIQTYVRALQQGVTTCPLVQRSLDIITGSLNAQQPPAHGNSVVPTTAASSTTTRDHMAVTAEIVTARNYLPAFPYRDLQVDMYADAAQLAAMDIDAFSLLDSFPEHHLDNVTGEWYMPS